MIKPLFIAATAIPLGLAPPVVTQAVAAPSVVVAQDERLSVPQMRDALEVQGYTEIRILQADGDMYQMTAKKNGQSVLLRANARTRRFSERPGG